MSKRRVDGFFYGLFMDRQILDGLGVTPVNARKAYVDGFALRIGRRATLISAPGARAYGMVFALTHDQLDQLYSAPGLEDYRPEALLVERLEGGELPALCYNLVTPPGPGEANAAYALQLRKTQIELGLPPD